MNHGRSEYEKLAERYNTLASEYVRLRQEQTPKTTTQEPESTTELELLRQKAAKVDKLQTLLEYKDNVISVLTESLDNADKRITDLSNKLHRTMLMHNELIQTVHK